MVIIQNTASLSETKIHHKIISDVMNKVIIYPILWFLYVVLEKVLDFIIYINRGLWKYNLDQQDIIESSVPTKSIYAKCSQNTGEYVAATHIKKKFHIYKLELEGGYTMTCADEHLVAVSFGYVKPVCDLKKGEPILTESGVRRVRRVTKLNKRKYMFDFTINSKDHMYYTNGILSHNSITSGIFLAWYLLNHKDRNAMITSENGDKVKELMEKIDVIMRGLPFFMKLGMITNNVMTKAYDNGCKVVAQTTTENTGASFTIHLLYCDEFALIQPKVQNKFYRTVFPTLSSSEISRMVITSTPRGMNKFYDIYNAAIESENYFNPIRTDWYEVPLQNEHGDPLRDEDGNILYRDEEFKQHWIKQLGSEEDFNQEFGNQFLAGSTLLFSSTLLKKLKRFQTEFVQREIEVFEDYELEYHDKFYWHPKFDMDNLLNEACRWVISIDLADGGGGDHSVINIFQILPMSKKEIGLMRIFSDEKDFFKLVQVGLFRSNTTPLPELAKMFYHLVSEVMVHDNTKVVLEMNHEGNYFRELVANMYGDNNQIEEDHLYVQFKYNMNDEKSTAYRIGLNQNASTKDYGCKVIKDKVKYNQMILVEKMTVEESISFAKNKKGSFESQSGHDDIIMTCVNLTHMYTTIDFAEQIDELMEYVPYGFIQEINKKLNKFESGEDDGILDLI